MNAREATIELPAELASITVGRHFARDVLVGWGLEELVDDAQLGTSELVTNAVRHARTALTLTLRCAHTVTIVVHDGQPELHAPSSPQVDPTVEHGRGLQIVAAISADWGVRSSDTGKSIWFTLNLPDENGADADVFAIGRRAAAEKRDDFHGEQDERAAGEQMRAAPAV